MKVCLTDKDAEELELNDGRWHKVKTEYDPAFPFVLVNVDNEYVAVMMEGLR